MFLFAPLNDIQALPIQRFRAPFWTVVDDSISAWTTSFLNATADIRSDVPFEDSANRLRELVKTDLLRATDIQEHPERFFAAHRM